MAQVKWTKGQDADVLRGQINAILGTLPGVEIMVANSLETVVYDDATLTGPQQADMNSLLNPLGFTKE